MSQNDNYYQSNILYELKNGENVNVIKMLFVTLNQ